MDMGFVHPDQLSCGQLISWNNFLGEHYETLGIIVPDPIKGMMVLVLRDDYPGLYARPYRKYSIEPISHFSLIKAVR